MAEEERRRLRRPAALSLDVERRLPVLRRARLRGGVETEQRPQLRQQPARARHVCGARVLDHRVSQHGGEDRVGRAARLERAPAAEDRLRVHAQVGGEGGGALPELVLLAAEAARLAEGAERLARLPELPKEASERGPRLAVLRV